MQGIGSNVQNFRHANRRISLHLYIPVPHWNCQAETCTPVGRLLSPILLATKSIANLGLIRRIRETARLPTSIIASQGAVLGPVMPHDRRSIFMRCPYCKNSQTEVFRIRNLRSKTYRYRRCQFCKAKFRTQERPVRWENVDRKWPGTAPNRRGWGNHRVPALRGNCEVESCRVDFKLTGAKRHVDHIVPARLIRRLRAGNPD